MPGSKARAWKRAKAKETYDVHYGNGCHLPNLKRKREESPNTAANRKLPTTSKPKSVLERNSIVPIKRQIECQNQNQIQEEASNNVEVVNSQVVQDKFISACTSRTIQNEHDNILTAVENSEGTTDRAKTFHPFGLALCNCVQSIEFAFFSGLRLDICFITILCLLDEKPALELQPSDVVQTVKAQIESDEEDI
ncbi:unnamed protein product [Brachionus calyciflorus]|uniref:Uncharacterized protein n=1 Tax=Brachionus calyciflorus TaxID=104777 RepID=A0A813RCE9_9BILA|nr:unnamed protein product [Brachionus calyciflorus]